MPTPKYTITQNTADSHQTSPGACVAIVRYANPASMYTGGKSLTDTKPLLIIQDDCIGISVENSKGSYLKNASLIFKSGEVYYPNAVANGDWVVVWIHEDQDQIEKIVSGLQALRQASATKSFTQFRANPSLNSWESGLKFIGRVTGVGAAETISANGERVVAQRIQCQAFKELDSSVYFTYMATAQFQSGSQNTLPTDALRLNQLLQAERFSGFAKEFATYLENAYTGDPQGNTPEKVIYFILVWLLGIQDKDSLPTDANQAVKGNFNDAIVVPSILAKLIGVPTGKQGNVYLYRFYNVILGLQHYTGASKDPWRAFSPSINQSRNQSNIWFTPYALKGSIIFKPPQWSGVTFWGAMNQYLNSLINEMYTCLRCDQFNRIRPTIIAREQPFGTGLFDSLYGPKVSEMKIVAQPDKSTDKRKEAVNTNKTKTGQDAKVEETSKSTALSPAQKMSAAFRKRGMYYNLPRWVIDESMVRSVSMSSSENNRVNFVQVFTTNSSQVYSPGPAQNGGAWNSLENYKYIQFQLGNYIADDKDIKRNGLRMQIFESEFGPPMEVAPTASAYWARIKADHMFNGHLKYVGSVDLNGVSAPICEGDNIEIRGVVFHIESVSHQWHIAGGKKSFTTSVSLSNGIMASSLTSAVSKPVYPGLAVSAKYEDQAPYLPGVTDDERRS